VRSKKIPLVELTTENDDEEKKESSPTADSEGDIESLGGAHTPRTNKIFSAREIIENLHAKFMQERKKTAQIEYPRSSSVPKIRVAFTKKRNDNNSSLLDDEESGHKNKTKINGSMVFDTAKKGTRPRAGTASTAMMPMIKGDHGVNILLKKEVYLN